MPKRYLPSSPLSLPVALINLINLADLADPSRSLTRPHPPSVALCCNPAEEVIKIDSGAQPLLMLCARHLMEADPILKRSLPVPLLKAFAGSLLLLACAGVAFADQEIELEDLRAKVLQGKILAYEIIAAKGQLGEKSRRINLEGPTIRIYNPLGDLRDEVTGQTGRFWPETIERLHEDGTREEITKYDWALEGGVKFRAENGMLIETPSMNYSHEVNLIRSHEGVRYRIPTGNGSVLHGTAQKFETAMGADGAAFNSWTLIGDVHLITKQAE